MSTIDTLEEMNLDYVRYGNLPASSVLSLLRATVETKSLDRAEMAEACYLYERKGELASDPIGGDRGPRYASQDDPILLKFHILLDHHDPLWDQVRGIGDGVRREVVLAERAEVELELKRAQARLEEAEAKLSSLN